MGFVDKMSDWVNSYNIKVWHIKLRLNLHKNSQKWKLMFLFNFQAAQKTSTTRRERQSIVCRRMNHNEKRMHEKKKPGINNKEIWMNGRSKHLNLPHFMTFKNDLPLTQVEQLEMIYSLLMLTRAWVSSSFLHWNEGEREKWMKHNKRLQQ